MRAILTAALILATPAMLAGAAVAEPVDGKTAAKMLFSPKGSQTVVRDDTGLSETDVKTLKIMFQSNSFPYYGAVAMSPGDGLVSEATNMAQNMHSPAAAAAAALASCNKVKKAKEPCIVVADVLPKRWQAEPLTLNQDATAALKDYRRGRGEKAMAISPATGAWSVAEGKNAALAATNDCLNKAQPLGAKDCVVVIADQ